MSADRGVEQHDPAAASSVPRTQVGRMQAAIDQAVAVAPSFQRGDFDAHRMAKAMVHAVRSQVKQEATGSERLGTTQKLKRCKVRSPN